MAVDVGAMFKDKRFLTVVGIGGAAGLFIYMKNKVSGTSTSTSAAGQGIQTSTGATGTYDSTSSDVANQLGQYQTGLQTALGQYSADQAAQLSAYQTQLTNSLAGLTAGQPTSTTALSTIKPWKAGNTYTADSVARRFGVTIDQLQAANPGSNIKPGILKNVTINVPFTATNACQFGKG